MIMKYGMVQKKNWNESDRDISLPLKQQVFRWFREKYSLHGYISRFSLSEFDYTISFHSSDKNTGKIWSANNFMNSYEEAESACIDKLIQLISDDTKEQS